MGNAGSSANGGSSTGSSPTTPTSSTTGQGSSYFNFSSRKGAGQSIIGRPILTQEDVASLPLISHYVYAVLAEYCYLEPDRRPLPDGWKELMTCEECRLNKEGYFAIAFVNEKLRHCIIAERGTQDALGLRAGVWMYFDEPTIQCNLAEQFSKLVRLRLSLTDMEGDINNPYFVSYTGHSLGAVLAACRACAEHTYAITFESPGCRAFVEKTMHPFRADDADIITYQRAPNPVNTLKPQMGYLVMLPYADPPSATLRETTVMGAIGDAGSITALTTHPVIMPSPQPVVSAVVTATTSSPSMLLPPPTGLGASTSSTSGAIIVGSPTNTSAATAGGASALGSSILSRRPKLSLPSFPSPQEYLRNKLLTQTFPEIQIYLTKLEPVMRELFNTTQQHHSIRSIVSNFEGKGGVEEAHQDVILAWPSHIMQFLEVYNIVKAMDEPANQDRNVYTAYQDLLQRLYHVKERPKDKLPMRFLNKDSQKLLKIWAVMKPDQLVKIPLQPVDRRALNSVAIESHSMVSHVLTAFQMKQYLTFVVARPEVRCYLDNFTGALGTSGKDGAASKL